MASDPDEVRDGVGLTHLDQELLAGDGDRPAVTKRALVDHLDAVADRILPLLANRPLSVVRARGKERFMQKNLPKGAPEWIRSVTFWSESSQRDVHYALAEDRATLLWFANQRAVEYHVPLTLADEPGTPTHLVLDLDPPEGSDLGPVVAAARAVREVLREAGFDPAVKTSGAKGLHVVTPIEPATMEDVHAATRAVAARAERLAPEGTTTAFIKADRGGKVFLDATRAGGATVVAAYSPRARPGLPVSCPCDWDSLDDVVPSEITVATPDRFLRGPSWQERLGEARAIPADLVEEGHTIPVARVAAMHEGKRRKRAASRGDG
ncbi:MAG: bifunctional non-ous end joining protein LigD [Actinomycetota bacterium]|nr:bifunctional non-ous end joining protein LigD [Actinomycetota bacterium]